MIRTLSKLIRAAIQHNKEKRLMDLGIRRIPAPILGTQIRIQPAERSSDDYSHMFGPW